MVKFMTFRRTSGRDLAAVRRPARRPVARKAAEVAPPQPEKPEPDKPKKAARKADSGDG